jgi:hypothetical protein
MTFSSPRLAGLLALIALALSTLACNAREAAPAATATATATATTTPAAASAPATAAGQDLRDFVARRQQCDHFRSEEGSTPKRKAELAAKQKEFCTGSDAQLTALKKKYSADKAASKTLAGFDAEIE